MEEKKEIQEAEQTNTKEEQKTAKRKLKLYKSEDQKYQNASESEINDGKMVRISKEADDALSDLLNKINGSDDSFKVTKWGLVSYVIERFCPEFSEHDIKAVLMKFVTDVDLLKLEVKRAMESGVIPDNLREILFANAGLTPGPKKIKKHRQTDGSNATVEKMESA